jgi:hypothetical protein
MCDVINRTIHFSINDSTDLLKCVQKMICLIIANKMSNRDLKVRTYELLRDTDFPLLFMFSKNKTDHLSFFRKFAINFNIRVKWKDDIIIKLVLVKHT